MIYSVKSEYVRDVWNDVHEMIQSALDHGNSLTMASSILESLESKEMQLYMVVENRKIDAVFITQIVNYDNAKVCVAVALAGKGVDKWLKQVEDTICKFAKSEDCEYVRLKGRRGWVKKLKDYGWYESSVTMVKGV